jgi:hypothetical protein
MNGLFFISNVSDAPLSAQLGIARGIAGLNNDTQVVAQSVTGSASDLTAALVDSLQQKLSIDDSASVLAGSDQMLGTLIDVMA